jgi:serine/threonine protein kinase
MGFERMMGTISYMAPEQMHGKPRPASDQYALAIMVYEWLCGERPFNGSLTEIFSQHLFVPPPSLHEKNPAISLTVEQVVFKALAKEPHDRFVDVQTFALELERAGSVGLSLPPIVSTPVIVQPAEPQRTPDLAKGRFQNVPPRLTPLIGREQEEKAVRAILMRPEVRLLAAEAVCDAPNDMQTSVLDGVSSLIDKSLLQQIEQENDEPRLRLLEMT